MGDHAKYAPSSANQWINCTGSVTMQSGFANLESDASLEGTAAHYVMEKVLLSYKKTGLAQDVGDWIGTTVEGDIIVTPQMAEAVQVIVDDVISVANWYGAHDRLLVEQRVTVDSVSPDNWGTCDVALLVPEQNVIFIWDYKHGRREVEAERNYQLINYFAGFADERELWGLSITASLRVVQPNAYHPSGPIRVWTVPIAELIPEVQLLAAAAYSAEYQPELTTGKHCRDCKAIGVCPAARRAAQSVSDYVGEPIDFDKYTDANLAVEYSQLSVAKKTLSARLDAVAEQLEHRTAQGRNTGYSLTSAKGKLKWTASEQDAAFAADQFGVDIRKMSVLTPTQFLALVPRDEKLIATDVVTAMTQRQAGATKLVPVKDSIAAKVFS